MLFLDKPLLPTPPCPPHLLASPLECLLQFSIIPLYLFIHLFIFVVKLKRSLSRKLSDIQNMAKKEYFLCAETSGAARGWVSTLHAAQLVLKAHKEAVSSLGGTGSAKLGTVAAVVAAANATAKEAAKEVAAAMQGSSLKAKDSDASHGGEMPMDAMSIMKETLRVKDEELHQVAKEMRAREATIKELAERLSETAEAAEAAASAAQIMDKERKAVRTEIAKLRGELEDKLRKSSLELKALKERLSEAERVRDEALQEASKWRTELAKARDQAVIMEAALHRAEEAVRLASSDNKTFPKCFQVRQTADNCAKETIRPQEEILPDVYHLNTSSETGSHIQQDGLQEITGVGNPSFGGISESGIHLQQNGLQEITRDIDLLGLQNEGDEQSSSIPSEPQLKVDNESIGPKQDM
ncbi:hypothetical protein KP509_06G054300 [Ceratopteris richardii]|uniref:Uncharacterized protein n=1 Tax=Ceratopteris richardii TaxID=49495 RepID=A0A8T2UGH9_CERRI|nr:hypothetical protein KP509_06G054300 [Ceratopteris richardii]